MSIYIQANISGVVFRDLPLNGTTLNRYGIKDINEFGVGGIKVTAYPENLTTTTDDNGSWSLQTTKDSRVEFSNLPQYLIESVNAKIENSSVRFVSDGSSDIYFGVHNPEDFSDTTNPMYVTNRQQNGSGLGNTNPSIERVHYRDRGLNQQFQNRDGELGTGPIPIEDTTVEEVGSIWGKAYQKDKKRLFASAVLQRHVGFAPNKGAGDIYVLDYNSSNSQSIFLGSFSLQGIIPSNGGNSINLGTVCRSASCKDDRGNTGKETDYILGADVTSPNIDIDAFAKVGKMSYGDIDFDQISDKLWLVNLYQKALISLDASGDFNSLTSNVRQYPIESISNVPTCIGGELRPWALTIHRQRGYLGAVCDASLSQDVTNLKAYVLSFNLDNPTSGFTQELSFDLDYVKDANYSKKNWHPWSDDSNKSYSGGSWKYYIQPILSDIEFDEKNTMYISFADRYGFQSGYKNYKPISGTTTIEEKTKSLGDIFRVCYDNGLFELEGTGNCTQTNYGNEFFNDAGGDTSEEYANGSLALLKGSKEIIVGMIDPHPEGDRGTKYWNTMGQNILSTEDGSIHNWYTNIYSGRDYGYNGKSQGMGDIELITADAPIEIGDRVWLDSNGNGVQDANESGIADVNITLICDNDIKAIATTDRNGYYIFSNDNNQTSTSSHIYNISSLKARVDNNCIIRIPNISGQNKQTALGDNVLTINNNGEGANPFLNDSNGFENNNSADINISIDDIPFSGINNHSLDFGFKPYFVKESEDVKTEDNITIGDRVWLDSNKNGIQDEDEGGVADIVVSLYQQNCSTLIDTNITDSNGYYIFQHLDSGSYCIKFNNISDDYNITIPNVGDDIKDSDVNPLTGIIELNSNDWSSDTNLSFDLGLIPLSTNIDDSNSSGTNDCHCDTYNNSVPSTNVISLFIIFFLTSIFVYFSFRKES
ncbi:MAG: hypothetical protein GXO60_08760 [Epsilonproteobacteria bacterium]|nr:hypothetical protein [Campylobacterota bacterium]